MTLGFAPTTCSTPPCPGLRLTAAPPTRSNTVSVPGRGPRQDPMGRVADPREVNGCAHAAGGPISLTDATGMECKRGPKY